MLQKTALALSTLFASGAQAQYTLTYDKADGTLVIDTLGGPIIGYGFEITPGIFIPSEYTTFLAGTRIAIPTVISETNPFVSQSGVFEIGAVLPVGLSEDEFSQLFLRKPDSAFLGEPTGEFDLVYVPEPASVALLGVGGLLLARRRR